MKALTFISIFLAFNAVCENSYSDQHYSNWPSIQFNSLYNPQPQYDPQGKSIHQQIPNFKKQQNAIPLKQAPKQPNEAKNSEYVGFNPQNPVQQPSFDNKPEYIPSNPQNPQQQQSAIGPPFSQEQIAQVAERASQLQLEEAGYAMTDTEKQEITNELILAQDYYISGDLDNEGGMNEYNRMFGFGNPLSGIGFSLAGAALKGLSSGKGGGSGMGGMMGMSGSSSSLGYLGKAIAPHIANTFKGEKSTPGEYVDSFFSVLKFFNSIYGG